ncbi:collagen alpha-1(I) chain-like [Dama dama]|uniref:collagen alpha-1(I) chain-like n=1 Tax=Dama dama TaxID=30532 RepID=UPI002A3585C0|nr:collagen alpha-1(I) chain-like [Dama dama]
MLAAAEPARRAAGGDAGARAGGGRRRRGRAAARAGVSRARRPLVCTVRVSGRPSAGECAAGPRGPARRGARGAARRARDWSPGVMCPPSDVNGGNAGRRRGFGLARAGSAGGGTRGGRGRAGAAAPGRGAGAAWPAGPRRPARNRGPGAGRLTSRRAAPPPPPPPPPVPKRPRPESGPRGWLGPGPGKVGPEMLGEGCPTWNPQPALAAHLDDQVTLHPRSALAAHLDGQLTPHRRPALAAHLDGQLTLHPHPALATHLDGHGTQIFPQIANVPSSIRIMSHTSPGSTSRTPRASWSFTDVCLPLGSSSFSGEGTGSPATIPPRFPSPPGV